LTTDRLLLRSFGRRYLRLDSRIPGYARLSPSILREFHTYCVIGLSSQKTRVAAAVNERMDRIQEISRFKIAVARGMIEAVLRELEAAGIGIEPAVFLLAGDIAYGMAHEEPRPERSTGRMVRGSDIDLVVLARDDAPDSFLAGLDQAIHREKYRLLVNPSVDQEIDCVVKRMSRLREQEAFDTFKRMVACKIVKEALLIEGDHAIFHEARKLFADSGVFSRLDDLEAGADQDRERTVRLLIEGGGGPVSVETAALFYSAAESEEFE